MRHHRPAPVARLLFLGVLIPILLTLLACSSRLVGPAIDETNAAREKSWLTIALDADKQLRQNQEYFIGPGDILFISIVGRPELFNEEQQNTEDGGFLVTQSPFISLPLVGAVRVHGKTIEQLRTELRDAYSRFLIDPQPIVFVKKFSANEVSVIGSVVKPGRYPLEFGDTLLDSIFKAGGFSMGGRTGGLAPGRYLKVYREKLDRRDRANLSLDELIDRVREDDKVAPREEITVPIQEFVFGGDLEYNLPLQPNDIVYVPPAGTAVVIGRVRAPGVAFLGPSVSTVTQVLTERGRLRFGAKSIVEVVRLGPDGKPVSYKMNARKMFNRELEDFVIQDGDQIFVYTHPVRGFLEWISNVLRASASAGASATYTPI